MRLTRRLLLSAILSSACRPGAKAPGAKAPPSVAGPGRVQLSPEAEARLAIPEGLRPLERRALPARRLLPGEVVPVPGRAALVTAPVSGVVVPEGGAALPVPGAPVRAGQALLALAPLLGPGERLQVSTALVDAEAQVARAEVQDEAAALALSRAERLVADQVAGARVLEEARAARDTARATLTAARAQRDGLAGRGGRGPLSPLRIEAPLSGVLRELRVAPRQQVAAGAALFEIAADDPVWIRAAAPGAALAALDPDAPALVTALGATPEAMPAPAAPTPAPTPAPASAAGAPATAAAAPAPPPAAADAAAPPAAAEPQFAPPVRPSPPTGQGGAVDLYFQLAGPGRPRLASRVAVWVAERGAAAGPVVPAAAILYDPAGGTFLYESAGAQLYLRRRVEVLRVEGPAALLSERSLRQGGLQPGARVVTAGAMELYGAELGGGK